MLFNLENVNLTDGNVIFPVDQKIKYEEQNKTNKKHILYTQGNSPWSSMVKIAVQDWWASKNSIAEHCVPPTNTITALVAREKKNPSVKKCEVSWNQPTITRRKIHRNINDSPLNNKH